MNTLTKLKTQYAERWLSTKIKRVLMTVFVLSVYKKEHTISSVETAKLFNLLSDALQLGYDSRSLVFLFWLVKFLNLESLYCKDGKIRFNALKKKCLLAYDRELMDYDISILTSLTKNA